MRARPIPIAAALALIAALSGCSSTSDHSSTAPSTSSTTGAMMSGSASAGIGGDADVAFAQLMIPHHQQAIQMADLAAANATSPEVKALAVQIKAAQGPEITMMSRWLSDWGAPPVMPGTDPSGRPTDSMDGMDMGGVGPSGMMSDDDISKLAMATGAAFDTMWLQMMITHHQGAIAMAEQVSTTTSNAQVKALADAVIAGQTAEIATMRQLLAN